MNDTGQYRDWKQWDPALFGQYSNSDSRYFELELRRSGVALSPGMKVLEWGFGNGSFAGWALHQQWKYTGVEIDTELVSRARSRGFDVHSSGAALKVFEEHQAYDLVVAFDVLEHLKLSDTAELLASIRGCLADGGMFIARFPSGDSPFSGAMQHGDFTHQTAIGSGIVRQLCLGAGLDCLQMRGPTMPVWGLGVRRAFRRLGILATRAVIGRALQVIYYDNQPRVLDPNMLIVCCPLATNSN